MTATMKVTNLQNESSLTPNIVLNADGTTTIPTQSTTNLAYTGTLTGSTGVINIGSGQIYKDVSGNVGVGTVSPTGYKLKVLAAFGSSVGGAYIEAGEFNQSNLILNHTNASVSVPLFQVQKSGTGVLTIDSSGNLLVGTASSSFGQSGIIFLPNYSAAGNSGAAIQHINGSASGSTYISFVYNAGQIGSIAQNGTTGVLFNTTSDYRLKNDPQPLTGSKDFIMGLQPKKWQWWDGSGEGVGFIAHEFMEVAKHSGNGEKDAVDENGKPVYQSIQPSSSEVIAHLTALVQEQQAIITQLQADVAALKGAA